MARNLSDADPETQAAAGLGHNSAELTQEVFEAHVSAILRNRNGPLALANAAVKAAKKTEKNLKARAKIDGIKLMELEVYLRLRQTDDEGVATENAQALHNYLVWGELLDGQQGDLFDGLTPTPQEAKDKYWARGYKDIREGRIDPEGFTNPDGTKSPGPIMPGIKPSYIEVENFQDWAAGAAAANEENERDAVEILGRKDTTPIEEKAKTGADVMSDAEPVTPAEAAEKVDAEFGDA